MRKGFFVTLLIIAACAPPRPTAVAPAPTAETAPVRGTTTSATPRPVSAPQDAPLGTVLDESFAVPSLEWPIDPKATVWWADGALHFSAQTPGQFVAFGLPGRDPFRDVAVTVQFHKEGGPPGGGFGIILRDARTGVRDGVGQDGKYLVIEVGDEGTLGVWQRQEDHWRELQPWTANDAVHPGNEPNELMVRVAGSHLLAFVNNVQAASLDISDGQGAVGLFAGGDGNQVAVERVIVQAPLPAGIAPRPSAAIAVTPTPVAVSEKPQPALSATPDPNWFEHARELIQAYDKKHGTVLNTALEQSKVVLAHRYGAWAAFVPSVRTITLDPVLQTEIPQASATVMAHEAVHASDFYLYGLSGTNVSCYTYEISAFHVQAVMWQEFFGPSGKSDPETELEMDLNETVQLAFTDPARLIRSVQSRYEDQCADRPN